MPKAIPHHFPSELKIKSLNLSKGESLFDQGDVVSNIYLIKSGRIKLTRHIIDGSSLILHIGNVGEIIAEASMFSKKYHCTALCDQNSEVSFVNKQDLLQLLAQKPEEMMRLLALFSRQIRDLRSINEIKNIRSANERILSYIRSNLDENKRMSLQVSLKDMAHYIGLAHETFYRELKKLEASGQISRNAEFIQLKK